MFKKFKGLIAPFCILVIILLGESLLTGLLPVSRGHLYEFLEAKNVAVWGAIGIYFLNYLFLDFFQAIKCNFVLRVTLWFRARRTTKICNEGVGKYLETTPQRIQEDIKLSYWNRIKVWCEYFISGSILAYLIVVNTDVPILIVAALVYAAISVGIAYFFNPRLNHAEQISQESEAKFRNSLSTKITDGLLGMANEASMKAQIIRTQYLLFTKLQLGLITVLPYIVLIPSLLAGEINLGNLVMHQATFALIVVNAAILIQYFETLIRGRASEDRVKEIEKI